jgi:hypothetical protein
MYPFVTRPSNACGAGSRQSFSRQWTNRHPTFRVVRPPRHPYALDTPVFAFAAIVTLAARAPLGGTREIALATFVTARMAADVADGALDGEARQARAASARRWLSTLTVAEPRWIPGPNL